jgi:hypothetical protein
VKLAALLFVIAAVPGACWPEAKFYGHIEVWNRRAEPITVAAPAAAARDKDEIRVPPCGHAARDGFLISDFEVLDSTGEVIAIIRGGSGPDPANPLPAYLVVTRRGLEGAATPPTTLAPCS